MQSGDSEQEGLRPCSVGTIWSFWTKNIKKRNEITGVEYNARGRGCRVKRASDQKSYMLRAFLAFKLHK